MHSIKKKIFKKHDTMDLIVEYVQIVCIYASISMYKKIRLKYFVEIKVRADDKVGRSYSIEDEAKESSEWRGRDQFQSEMGFQPAE